MWRTRGQRVPVSISSETCGDLFPLMLEENTSAESMRTRDCSMLSGCPLVYSVFILNLEDAHKRFPGTK